MLIDRNKCRFILSLFNFIHELYMNPILYDGAKGYSFHIFLYPPTSLIQILAKSILALFAHLLVFSHQSDIKQFKSHGNNLLFWEQSFVMKTLSLMPCCVFLGAVVLHMLCKLTFSLTNLSVFLVAFERAQMFHLSYNSVPHNSILINMWHILHIIIIP